MARSWVEFVQSQNIPWSASDVLGLRPGADAKVLSDDPETGAASMLVRYPAGFTADGGPIDADEEFLVLDGDLSLGDTSFAPMSYAHLPAGYETGRLTTRTGAVVLQFLSRRPARLAAPRPFDPARLVAHLDAFQVPYTGNFHPEFPPGAGRKLLYKDPATGDTSWILGTMPMRWAARSEVHPVVEEMYLLSGEVHGDRGVMRPGAYFWRPPHSKHGPYGTLTGNLYFFRTKGGALVTDYVDGGREFRWWPEYAPVLPESLEAARGEGQPGARCW